MIDKEIKENSWRLGGVYVAFVVLGIISTILRYLMGNFDQYTRQDEILTYILGVWYFVAFFFTNYLIVIFY